uniref:LRP chaperone MESD n=1 Tax=Ciona savignyi TaxID=51511 RepID=H2Z9H9_CIOSA
MKLHYLMSLLCVFHICLLTASKKKKDPRDFTDADIYKLEEEWTEDGEIDEGDLPEHLRPAEPLDMSKLNPEDPEGIVKMSKRHKTLMMFVTISGDPTQEETEEITQLWQSMLYNANIEVTRFVLSANRVLIKISDGSYAYEIRDFLVAQDRCEAVTIEGKDYPGKGSPLNKGKKPAKTKGKKKTGKKKATKTEL